MRTLHFISIIILMLSCQENAQKEKLLTFHEANSLSAGSDEDILTPSDSFFVFYKNCQLSKDEIKEREEGDKIVFQYFFRNTDYISMKDENYTETIQFELSPTQIQKE